MLFNTIDFTFFLPIVFTIYWLLKDKLKFQNLFLAMSSYVFYGWWDWKFLFLILFSTLVDYCIANKLFIEKQNKKRKLYLILSLLINLGLLGVFKYYNFFVENFNNAFTFFGTHFKLDSLNLILPVGISFYTFQTMSYTIDVYKNKLNPTKDFIVFATYVSFFPQLVAGPIERAVNLLPQFYKKKEFNSLKAYEGIRQILWGLFKKIVIADNCSLFVDDIFTSYYDYSGGTLILGAILFSFQIYCDFSGYSDIAIGVAKLFNIDLMTNFKTPYFSRNIAEFWRRWHISLSTWFRDYVYIPLGGSEKGKIITIRNIFIIFIVSGFWHGANWTYIFWGALNAMYFLPVFLMNKNRKYTNHEVNNKFVGFYELLNISITFSITTFAWIFFRSKSLSDSFLFIKGIFNSQNFFKIQSEMTYQTNIRPLILYLVFFLIIEWIYRNDEFVFKKKKHFINNFVTKYFIYLITIMSIILSIKNETANFIYFQF